MQVAVIGASGGVGASVLSAALALRLSTRASVALVDLDDRGAGMDFVLGVEQSPGLRWDDLSEAGADIDGAALFSRLVAVEALRLLSYGPSPPHPTTEKRAVGSQLRTVLDALEGATDYVVLDAGAHLPQPGSAVVLVVSATCRGIRSGSWWLELLDRSGNRRDDLVVVVDRISHRAIPAEQVGAALGCSTLTSWVREPDLAIGLESGDRRCLREPSRDGLVAAALRLSELL